MEIQNKNDELQRELTHFRRDNAEKLHLQKTIENLQKQQIDMVEKNKKLQKKLEEILPESIKDEVSFESSRGLINSGSSLDLMMELEKLKSYLNNVELQLYEANEHISDLLEKKQELEADNLTLKSETAELKNLTKLMQANMYETLSTSKRMEETFLRVKLERDELIKRHNRDSTDGKATTVTEEIANLKTELKRQKAHYEAQFIEYKQNVEKEMEERINSEVESLKIQVQLLEIELETSRNRAENAEEELRQFKATIRLSAKMDFTATDSEIEKPKMVPPPPPPPPPPPMFDFGTQVTIRSRSNSQTEQSLSDAISNAQNTLTNTSSRKNMKASTGRIILFLG
ncbi:hypothetical protein ACKWTF_013471 [Chironomus riparius]